MPAGLLPSPPFRGIPVLPKLAQCRSLSACQHYSSTYGRRKAWSDPGPLESRFAKKILRIMRACALDLADMECHRSIVHQEGFNLTPQRVASYHNLQQSSVRPPVAYWCLRESSQFFIIPHDRKFVWLLPAPTLGVAIGAARKSREVAPMHPTLCWELS